MSRNIVRGSRASSVIRLLGRQRLTQDVWQWRFHSFRRGDGWVRLLAGGLLITSSVFKAYGLFATDKAAALTELPAWMMLSLLPAEVMLGLALIAGFWARLVRLSTLTLFSAFACYSLRAAVDGRPSCGCFGQVTISPWAMFFVDASVIAMLLWWQPKVTRPAVIFAGAHQHAAESLPLVMRLPLLQPRYLAALIPCVMIGLPAGWIASQHRKSAAYGSSREVFVAEPKTWIDKELPLVPNIDIGQELLQGDWIVLLYHYDCPTCQDAMAQYQRNGGHLDPSAPRIAFVEVPPCDPSVSPHESACRRGRLDNSRDWFVETPTHLLLLSGVVRIVSRKMIDPDSPRSESVSSGVVGSQSTN